MYIFFLIKYRNNFANYDDYGNVFFVSWRELKTCVLKTNNVKTLSFCWSICFVEQTEQFERHCYYTSDLDLS